MGMTRREVNYILNRMQTIGPETYELLMGWYGTPEDAWEEQSVPLPEKQRLEWEFHHQPEREDVLRWELECLAAKGIRFLDREEKLFPENLRNIPYPPIGIYVKGQLPEEKRSDKELPGNRELLGNTKQSVITAVTEPEGALRPGMSLAAMIGARRCTEYGKEMALSFGRQLAEAGIGVVSGMAMGIDSWSQWGAVKAGGYSVAVLGTGIDVCYPSSNLKLYRQLEEQGCIISEYGPGDQGLPFHFPMRNRLISGLSKVVIVLEAREKSGSLITVDYALEQGREVLALPGRLGDPLSQGCNQLIRQGAGILTGISDVLRALGLNDQEAEEQERREGDPLEGLPEKERKVYERIRSEPVHQDILAEKTGIPLTELFGILWELEQRGLIRNCQPGSYIRIWRG